MRWEVLPLLVDWIYRAVLHPHPFWAFLYAPRPGDSHRLRLAHAHLPDGATRWNILELDRSLLPSVPEPVIVAAPDVGRFAIVRPARH